MSQCCSANAREVPFPSEQATSWGSADEAAVAFVLENEQAQVVGDFIKQHVAMTDAQLREPTTQRLQKRRKEIKRQRVSLLIS